MGLPKQDKLLSWVQEKAKELFGKLKRRFFNIFKSKSAEE
jgi:hypothetical protein